MLGHWATVRPRASTVSPMTTSALRTSANAEAGKASDAVNAKPTHNESIRAGARRIDPVFPAPLYPMETLIRLVDSVDLFGRDGGEAGLNQLVLQRGILIGLQNVDSRVDAY